MSFSKKIILKISYLILLIASIFAYSNVSINAMPISGEVSASVAYFTESNFFEEIKNDTDKVTRRLGYGYDYLQAIGQYENITYSYDKVDRATGLKKLKSGEDDIMLGISKTEAREKYMLFPQLPMGTETYYLYSKEEDSSKYADYSDFMGKTVAVEKNSVLYDELNDWNNSNDEYDINIVEFDTEESNDFDNIFSLTNADLIAYCDIYLTTESGLYPVVEFGASEIYMAVSKKCTIANELIDLIDHGQSAILRDNQSYLTDLANKYFSNTPARRMLSSMEKSWITQNKVLNVGYYDYFPMVTGSEEDVEGAFVTILETILDKFELNFEIKYHKYTEYSKMISDLNNGKLNLIMPSYGSVYKAEKDNVLTTNSVLASTIKIIYSDSKFDGALTNGDTNSYTIAILGDSPMQNNFVKEYLPNCKTIICSDLKDCLRCVSNGNADFTIISNYRQSVWVDEKASFKVADTDYIINYKFALSNGSTSLLTIINRGLNIIGNENIQNIVVSYIEQNQKTSFSLSTWIKNHIVAVILIVIVLVVLVMIALYWCISKTKVRHNLERLATHDALTGIQNRRAYNLAVSNIKKYSLEDTFAIYVSDIDNLKQTNDTKGHDAGDELIKAYASIANKYFSQIGTLYKTGGDEFVALLNSDRETLNSVIELIINECSLYKGDVVDKIDFSYGVSYAKDLERTNFDNLYHIAEENMYTQKESKKEYKQQTGYVLASESKYARDKLTNLYTMDQFYLIYSDLNNEIYKLSSKPVIVSINVNSFKRYNKRFGFDEGSKLLVEIAQIMAKAFGMNRCSRFSEDKFFAIAPDFKIEEKIKSIFDEFGNNHTERFVTLRAGLCKMSGNDSIVTYCDNARLACESDKSEYESHYVLYSNILAENYEIKQYVLENIDKAIKDKEIVAYYQPKVNPYNGKLTGFEALARWISKEKGMISPGQFIPVLDEYNITYKVDFEVLKQTAENMNIMLKQGLKPVPVSFNISRVDFNVLDICGEINNIIDSYNLPHKYFQIEITETVIMSNMAFIKQEVEKFKNNGYDVLMDDFGSAYSSLGNLREIDFDEIKIDASFMFNFSSKSRIILETTLKLCRELKIKACVEGVETYEQVQFLKKLKVDEIQGYYYGKPINYIDTINKWFRDIE